MLPEFYQIHLQSQLKKSDYLIVTILINLLQSIKQVNLEKLATAFPLPILFESRRRKLQRFLVLPQLSLEAIWLPLMSQWLKLRKKTGETIYLAIDRTRWESVNILMISLIWNQRSIPVYFQLLPKEGNSNLGEQKELFSRIIPILTEYRVVVLGDREFCSVELGKWLAQKGLYFCLRLKKSHFVEVEPENWFALKELGLIPGSSFYLRGVKVTKSKQVEGFDLASKWQRKYQGFTAEEGWFIFTNLGNLEAAISAYKKRFGIEEMFRDFKKGGYNLEGTNVKGQRLVSLLILISIAYTSSTIQGEKFKQMGVQEYIGRVKEVGRREKRHSNFYIGLYGETWIRFWFNCCQIVTELIKLNRNKHLFYQRGLRAINSIQYSF